MGFGQELQQQRKQRGIELEAIAAGTRVSIRHLRALEDEDAASLPGGVFNKGIVRSYCEFVGLNEVVWMERLASSSLAPTTDPDWEEFAENVRRNRPAQPFHAQRRWGGVALMVLGLALLVWGAWRASIQPKVQGEPRPAHAAGVPEASSVAGTVPIDTK